MGSGAPIAQMVGSAASGGSQGISAGGYASHQLPQVQPTAAAGSVPNWTQGDMPIGSNYPNGAPLPQGVQSVTPGQMAPGASAYQAGRSVGPAPQVQPTIPGLAGLQASVHNDTVNNQLGITPEQQPEVDKTVDYINKNQNTPYSILKGADSSSSSGTQPQQHSQAQVEGGWFDNNQAPLTQAMSLNQQNQQNLDQLNQIQAQQNNTIQQLNQPAPLTQAMNSWTD